MSDTGMVVDADGAWSDVVGQDRVVRLLRQASGAGAVHAWMFVGPHGSGKRAAARAFAGDLLAYEAEEAGDEASAERSRAFARTETHPDQIVVERVGPAISAEQADEIIRLASRSANEGRRKVLVLDEFHLIQPRVGPKLLKTIEEPPGDTFFIVLADDLPPDLVTIASRCIQVEFASLSSETLAARLEQEGVEPERAAEAAGFSGGDLGRARVLATDDRLALRLAAWRGLPMRLDGTGATAATAIDDIRAAIDDAQAPLEARHAREATELDERIERYGQRGSGSADLDKRHKRESRRFRTDEVRMGLASLAGTYRDELAVAADPEDALAAIAAVQAAAEAIAFNPNEELLLLSMALALPSLA